MTDGVVFGQLEEPKKPSRGEIAFIFNYGTSDFYRNVDDRYSLPGEIAYDSWEAGISLRSGKKWYEVRVDLTYSQQGGVEQFLTNVDGQVDSELSLTYLKVKAQPVNIRLQKDKYYLHFGGGGYAALLLQNEVKVNDRIFENERDYLLNEYDYGLVFSAGLGYGRFNVIATYQTGFQNILQESNNEVLNHSFALGLNIWL